MSKGLEALRNIKREKPTFFSAIYDGDMWEEDTETIEKELKDYERYKAIEDEYGIDLITVFKALRDGIHTKDYGYVPPALLSIHGCRIEIRLHGVLLPFKGPVGYGKSWALTEEELK